MFDDYIRIVLPTALHNNYGIECYFSDPSKAQAFERMCLRLFPSDVFGTFFQGGHGSPDWRYFEFWNGFGVQDEILEIGSSISAEFGLELLLEMPNPKSRSLG